jgi:ABC-type polysaccharide/polyol phosphate export permease
MRALVERDLRARYKQTFLGVAWALIQPVGLLVVFTFFVDRVGKVYTAGVPFQLYTYIGLIVWGFFSASVANGGQSLLTNMSLLNKIYCPREVFPLASIGVAGIDSLLSASVLVVLFPLNGFAPKLTSLWFPVIFLVQAMFTIGVVLVICSAIVYVRDVRHALPIALQLGLFATPIAYSWAAIPVRIRPIYSAVNPLGPVIESYRRTILLGQPPLWGQLGIAAASSALAIVGGWYFFKRLETGIADVA